MHNLKAIMRMYQKLPNGDSLQNSCPGLFNNVEFKKKKKI